jgi:large subunit ribosomal protein L10
LPSEKILEQKKLVVAALCENIKGACTGVVVNYRGITVAEDTKLRKELREAGDEYMVVKNTLLRLALKDAGIDGLDHVLEGTTAIAISKDNYVSGAKILTKFAEATKNKKFEIKAGFVDGGAIDVDGVKALATLPSKEVLVAQVLGGLNAPITGFVTVLNGTMKGLVVALNAIAEKQAANA